jgi:DNA primase large subunit
MEELIFAQKFPFSEQAKKYLKASGMKIEDVSEREIKRAALMISRAFSSQNYVLDMEITDNEIFRREIIAFPIAKLIISLMKIQNINEKFSELIRKKTFDELINEKQEIYFSLADDFGINYELSDKYFVSIPLLEYLQIYFVDDETKLINKKVFDGKVYLNSNDFAHFLAEKAYAKVFDSLPIPKESIPNKFNDLARNIASQLIKIQQKNFDEHISTKMDPSLFPPSMKTLYDKQLAGEKLSYYERLAIGGFLYQVGMRKEEMMNFFSKSPDFKKHIAEYHVNRIYEKGLSAPGYKKMNEYGIVVLKEEKQFKHPVAYYLSKIKEKNRRKNNNQ